MIPHERSLVQRYAGRPFALLGVNADESPDQLRRFQEQTGMTWPSWWDGAGGKISAAWQVDRYPAFFLIDHQGVIRWRHFGALTEGELAGKIDEYLTRMSRNEPGTGMQR
jgi:hypothetical protein